MAEEPKRLYRSRNNRLVAGVIGGLGEFVNIDPVVLRLAWLVVVVMTGVLPGVIAYIIAIFIVPEKPLIPTQEKPNQ